MFGEWRGEWGNYPGLAGMGAREGLLERGGVAP